jgi:hypothetical protein
MEGAIQKTKVMDKDRINNFFHITILLSISMVVFSIIKRESSKFDILASQQKKTFCQEQCMQNLIGYSMEKALEKRLNSQGDR